MKLSSTTGRLFMKGRQLLSSAGGPWSVIIFVATLAYLLSFWKYGINQVDEGSHLNGAQRIVDGEVLYRDFYCAYGPGRYYLLALWFKLFGSSLFVARLWWYLVVAVSAVMIYRVGRRLMAHPVALAAAAYFVLVPVQHYKIYFVFVYMVVILSALRAVESGTRRAWLWVGLWCGVAFLLRFEMALFGPALALAVLVLYGGYGRGRLREMVVRAACLAGGVAAVVVPLMAYYAAAGYLGKLLYYSNLQQVQHFRFYRLPHPSVAREWTALWNGGFGAEDFLRFFDSLACYAPAFLCAAATLVALYRVVAKRRRKEDAAIFAVGLGGLLMQPYFFARADFDHLLHITFVMYLLLFFLAARLFPAAGAAAGRAIAFWPRAVSFVACVLFLAGFACSAVWKHPEEGGTIGKMLRGNTQLVSLPRAVYYDRSYRAQMTLKLRRFVDSVRDGIPPNGIAVLKNGGFWYFILETGNPTSMDPLLSYYVDGSDPLEKEEEAVIRSLSGGRVRYLLFQDVPPDHPDGVVPFKEVHKKLWPFIEAEFVDVPGAGWGEWVVKKWRGD